MPILDHILKDSALRNHRSYLRAMNAAGEYLKNPEEMNRLIGEAQSKLNSVASQSMDAVGEGLDVLMRILKAYATGEYREIPWRTLAVMTAAIIYFVMPLDFLPDLLPVLGLMDDVALIAWTLSQVKIDIDNFLAWEARQAAAGHAQPLQPPAANASAALPAGQADTAPIAHQGDGQAS